MRALAERLALPDHIISTAKKIFDDNIALTRGSPYPNNYKKTVLEASSLYLACRLAEVPRTLNDFAIGANVDRRFLARYYRSLLATNKYNVNVVDPIIFLNRVASRLGLSKQVIKYVQEQLLPNKEICSLVGRDPMTRLASMIYIACVKFGETQTQHEIAEVCGITAVSVKNGYQKIKKMRSLC